MAPPTPKSDIEWLRDRVEDVTKCVHKEVMPSVGKIENTLSEIKRSQIKMMKDSECLKNEVVDFKDAFENRYRPFLETEILTRVRWQEKTQKVQTALLIAMAVALMWFLLALVGGGALAHLRALLGIGS